jgi:hypothetical protein
LWALNRATGLVVVRATSAPAVVVVDPPGGVDGLDGQSASSVDDSDVDPLLGSNQLAAAGYASLHAQAARQPARVLGRPGGRLTLAQPERCLLSCAGMALRP